MLRVPSGTFFGCLCFLLTSCFLSTGPHATESAVIRPAAAAAVLLEAAATASSQASSTLRSKAERSRACRASIAKPKSGWNARWGHPVTQGESEKRARVTILFFSGKHSTLERREAAWQILNQIR